MSLDIYFSEVKRINIASHNITHNLVPMAKALGVYNHLWHPERIGIKKASELITRLEEALYDLQKSPEVYKKLNPDNGWGSYDVFVDFLYDVIRTCKENPESEINTST